MDGGSRTFSSPTGHISCELTNGYYQVPDAAYCQWEDLGSGFSATLHPDGAFDTCYAGNCLGDPGLDTPTLGNGDTVAIGGFRCAARSDVVTCTALLSGRGFTIGSDGIAPATG